MINAAYIIIILIIVILIITIPLIIYFIISRKQKSSCNCSVTQHCANNSCVDNCPNPNCKQNEICNPTDGSCKPNPCLNISCSNGEKCVPLTGECVCDNCSAYKKECKNNKCVPCTSDQIFDPTTNKCVPNLCLNISCSEGEKCVSLTGECVCDNCSAYKKECKNNKCVPCTSDQVFDPTTNKCVPNLCANVKCKPYEKCNPIDGKCYPLCYNIKCNTGYKCDPTTGNCIPNCSNVTCDTCYQCNPDDGKCYPFSCPTGQKCVNNKCIPNCSDVTCDSCYQCNPNDGKCYPLACPLGYHCENNKCVPNCPDIKCPDKYYCNEKTKVCVQNCTYTTCQQGQYCEQNTGKCVDLCITKNATCPNGTTCDTSSGYCSYPCVNGSCNDPFLTCVNGQCLYLGNSLYISSIGMVKNVTYNIPLLWNNISSSYVITSTCGNQYLQFFPGKYTIRLQFSYKVIYPGPFNIFYNYFTASDLLCSEYSNPNVKVKTITDSFTIQESGNYNNLITIEADSPYEIFYITLANNSTLSLTNNPTLIIGRY